MLYRSHGDPAGPAMPSRVRAALAFLDHCRIRTDPADSAVAAPELSAAERAVERLALRVLAQYFSGEMDFGDIPPTPPPEAPPDDGDAPVPQPA